MRIGIYLADQVWVRTLSKGIYAYSRLLASELPARLSEHAWTLIVNRANWPDMVPCGAGSVHTVVLPEASAMGLARVACDNLVAPLLARRLGFDLFHFPKGFAPWLPMGRTRVTATVHDAIPLYYARHHPGFFPAIKLRYLRATMVNTLRRSHGVVTDSNWSRDCLLALADEAEAQSVSVAVCPLAPHPELARPEPIARSEHRLVHFGSLLPHKRTYETIRLFRRFNSSAGGHWRLRVVGLSSPPAGWSEAAADEVEFLGPLTAAGLRRELAGARALLLLSEVEGFGLPALEAWFQETPVCYSSAGAVGEVLQGVPGRCDAMDLDSFAAALAEVLVLGAAERSAIAGRLKSKYGSDAFGERMAQIVRGWLETI